MMNRDTWFTVFLMWMGLFAGSVVSPLIEGDFSLLRVLVALIVGAVATWLVVICTLTAARIKRRKAVRTSPAETIKINHSSHEWELVDVQGATVIVPRTLYWFR